MVMAAVSMAALFLGRAKLHRIASRLDLISNEGKRGCLGSLNAVLMGGVAGGCASEVAKDCHKHKGYDDGDRSHPTPGLLLEGHPG